MKRLAFSRPALALAAATSLLAASCSAPRNIISTGKVTPRGEFRGGGNVSFNIASETISQTGATLKSAAEAVGNKDTVGYSRTIDNLQLAALAYTLDPLRASPDLYLRYGIYDRFDVGYKYAFGSHIFDAMYQFMGPTGTPERPQGAAGATYGSIGLQFATQRAKLPSIPYLSNISDVLGFSASRKDLIVPLVISHSFGPEEEIGAFSYGLVYSRSFLRYGFNTDRVYTPSGIVPSLPEQRVSYNSFGAFASAKIGYRYVYFLPSMGVYYQNYGTYQLLNNATGKLSGFTFVPSVGVQFRVPNSRR
ncbi:hypothetical protein [Hymenobacter canadensis]|uniref:Outer membrane protein beta-barrel domain-containing protein n=1 Tax=Hymenobacter canadensis TaxID=2999067 RepID=A0ABY7LSQ4_9BACT|nr:hypothetical protein [Hymenobacter canadensis]WBA41933.1 hypothetical protein O3303_19250 [Hymenobacter canadensis]